MNPLPADSFSKYKTKVIPNKVCIIKLYTIKYCIFRVNRLIFSRNFTSIKYTIIQDTCKISAEDESIDSKYTVFNCVKFNYAHFIRNYFSLIYIFFLYHLTLWLIYTTVKDFVLMTLILLPYL